MLDPSEIVSTCNARVRTRGKAISFRSISTDSRNIKGGDLFFALTGPNFDGHHFIDDAFSKGADGAVMKKGRKVDARKGWLFTVEDPLRALGDLAGANRKKYPDTPVIAITGSSGKTTTKELTAALLATKYRIIKSEGNFNNLIGLPLTLNKLGSRHEIAVVEMGTNAPGEIRRMTEIASPSIGVVTNIARAHLEGFGSLKGIAREKGSLIGGLPPEGLAVLNADDPYVLQLARKSRADVLTYGFGAKASIRAANFRDRGLAGSTFTVSVRGKHVSVRLHLPGRHNVSNALAAIAVASRFGIYGKFSKPFGGVTLPGGRMERIRLANGGILINDSYNANPDSVLKALDIFLKAGTGRRKIAVLGDMLELGRSSKMAHREVGRRAARADMIVAVGRYGDEIIRGARSADIKKWHRCRNAEDALGYLEQLTRKDDIVLIKGSHGVNLEATVRGLKQGRGL